MQNEKKFLADCYAASQPTDKLISAYMMEVRRLKDNGDISIDDYYLLRSHRSALNMLEEKTMGDPEAITGTAIEEILERIQIDIKARESEKLEMEKNEHAKTKKDLDEERQKNTERENCLDAKAETLATWVFYILFVMLSVFFAVCWCLQEAISRGWIKVLIIVVLVVVNLLSWLFGWSFWGFRPKIVLYLKQTIKKLIYT